MRKRLIAGVVTSCLLLGGVALAVPSPKYFVCKYVGTPGVNETLQTGQNPISVSGNALPNGTTVGSSFADAQGRSYVVAEDTGQEEPNCPVPENDVCPNIDGKQTEVPVGKILKEGECVDPPVTNPEEPKTPPKDETPQVQGSTNENLVPFQGK